MSIEQTALQDYKNQSDSRPTTTVTLTPNISRVIADTTGGAFTCTLAPAAEMIGKIVSFRIGAGTNAMTLAFTGDGVGLSNLTTLDAVDDRTSYYSDGFCWLQMSAVIA
jgi:hypothetical protein